MSFAVDGRIGTRWRAWGAAKGAFGLPLGPEEDVPGRNGRRQRFERGEIAWSQDQDMVVSVYQLRNEACFEWEKTGFDYDYFRYDISYNGIGQGHAATQLRGTTHIWTRLQGFGEYAFTVKGCHSPTIGADECEQGFTIPVKVELHPSIEPLHPGDFEVNGVIAERWHELGALSGPLGKPITQEVIAPVEGSHFQKFEHGMISTAPRFGARMVVAVYQRGRAIEVNWGGTDTAYNAFRIVYTFNNQEKQGIYQPFFMSEWARPSIGSGLFRLDELYEVAFYTFVIYPTITSSPFTPPEDFRDFGNTPEVQLWFTPIFDAPLNPPTLDGTPAHAFAFATDKARANVIARHYAVTRPLNVTFDKFRPSGEAIDEEKGSSENDTIRLIAHLHLISKDTNYCNPGELPSRILVPIAIRQMVRGKVGTKKDYDMCLKGIMVILYRYRELLTDEIINFILRELVPNNLFGGHSLSTEEYDPGFLIPLVPETENHLLMIESTRYLVNQLQLERTGDQKYNNVTNGLRDWLLGFMQTISKHDFLEFNSRPYQRLSIHALLNLHEFGDEKIKTAAQIILDYTMVKFAVSSSRQRRIAPFRRIQHRINHPDNANNDLLGGWVDQLTGFFSVYVGSTDLDGKPTTWFFDSLTFNALIAGLAAYRPPTAAYILAMTQYPPAQHRFYHGIRPQLHESPDVPDGGVEIYFKSPSFVVTAGGMFLNSGYGYDNIDFFVQAWEQTSREQATTLLPTRADVTFKDLIRFDPYPDPFNDPYADEPEDPDTIRGEAVNTGVHKGFACGANLCVPDMWLALSGTAWEGNWLFLNLNRDIPESNPLGFYVALYRTPVATPELLDPVPDNLGFLYAMEADTKVNGVPLGFEEFKNLTLERNGNLPQILDYGGIHNFHSADNHRFTFWLMQAGEKYRARVIPTDEENAVVDFTSLPLVDGPYLRSRGHDGFIEIRYPDPECNTPLVLDFSNPLNPIRLDNDLACPKPWIERSQALQQVAQQLLSLSQQLVNEGKQADAIMSVQAAVDVLQGFQPPASEQLSFMTLLAESLRTLVLRLIEAQRVNEVSAPALGAIQVYRQAAVAGSEVTGIATSLIRLSSLLAHAGLAADSLSAAQAAVDVLRGIQPPASEQVSYLALLAQSLRTLVLQLLQTQQINEVSAPALEAIQVYRQAVAAGAETTGIAHDLQTLSSWLANARLTAEAVSAAQAAVDVLRGFQPPATEQSAYLTLLAGNLSTLVLWLIDSQQINEVSAPALEAIQVYRQAAAAGAEVTGIAGSLRTLSSWLANAGLTAEADAAADAAVGILP